MANYSGDMRPLQYPLNNSAESSAITETGSISEPVLNWGTTDNDEKISVTLTLSLNEYIALASAVDVGRDIAFGSSSIEIWWLWIRSINPMAFCEQVNDCIDNNTSTIIAINNTLLSTGIVNPDQIQPLSPEMDNRFPPALRDTASSPPPPACDKDELWSGILEMVQRIDQSGRDFLEEAVSKNDAAERISNIIDLVPLFGDIAADVITIFSSILPDILNSYNAHQTPTQLEDVACDLFEMVCDECRYPTYEELYDYYSNFGITGVGDIANMSITALMDYIIGSNNLGNLVVWYTMQCCVLFTMYLGGTFAGYRGLKWLKIWAAIGASIPSNNWTLLCDGCVTCDICRLGGDGNADMVLLDWGGGAPYGSTIGVYEAGNDLYSGGISFDNLYRLLRVDYVHASQITRDIHIESSNHVTRAAAGSAIQILADGVEISLIPLSVTPTSELTIIDLPNVTFTTLQFSVAVGVNNNIDGNGSITKLDFFA